MIYGVGTDVVEIGRIEKALARFGERFAKRILCEPELKRFVSHRQPAAYLAKRFAAKEAFSKAIGTGIHAPFTWHSITVTRNAKGKPGIEPSAAMQKHLKKLGVTGCHISLTDDGDVAMAFVVLEAKA